MVVVVERVAAFGCTGGQKFDGHLLCVFCWLFTSFYDSLNYISLLTILYVSAPGAELRFPALPKPSHGVRQHCSAVTAVLHNYGLLCSKCPASIGATGAIEDFRFARL